MSLTRLIHMVAFGAATIAVICLAACATQAVRHDDLAMQKAEIAAQSFCEGIPFPSLPQCVRDQFNLNYPGWQADSNADLVEMFLSWIDAATARIAKGEMTESDGWQGAFSLYGRLKDLAIERYQAQQRSQQINGEQAAAMMYAGLALLAVGQQQTAPTTIISCRGHWIGRFYYTDCR